MTFDPASILVGVGKLYLAPYGTAAPVITAVPSTSWTYLGETDGGVKISYAQKIDEHHTDQRTGIVKETRSEEHVMVETSLVQATLENLAKLMGASVTPTAAGTGTAGTLEVTFNQGVPVTEYAILFRGVSAYGANWPSQYYIPRGAFAGNVEAEFNKVKKVLYKLQFKAMEDLNAAIGQQFGKVTHQNAAAL
jgi:hypothetical protein